METHALTIEPDQRALLEQLAASQLRSPEVLVREAVEEYLTRQQAISPEDRAMVAEHDAVWDAYDGPTLTREQMLADLKAASEEYDRTGLHLTGEEVDAWLAKLQAGEGAPLPECHV